MMTNTETRYAQIKKEALAITWACEKFSQYILGKRILLETDHKPLVPLFSYKHLDNLPPRVLRFCLRLMRFDYQISHVPGKYLYTADALSPHSRHNRSYSTKRGRTFYSDCGDPPTSQQRASGGILSSTANRPHMHCSQNLLYHWVA